ncbi:MAG: exopolysaccharide biosynthesis polyprenyl glycosylphosphotransferase [Thermosynechococcaceae cyanobacterium]
MGWLQKHATLIWTLQRSIDIVLAVAILWGLSVMYQVQFSAPYIILAAITALIMWPVLGGTGIYYSYRSEHPAATYPYIWMGWASVASILLLLGYLTQTSEFFSRLLLCSWFGLTPLVLCVHHLKVRLLLRKIRATGFNSRTAVIAGTGALSQLVSQQFGSSPQLGLQFCGFFAEQPLEEMAQIVTKPLIGTLEELPDYVRRYNIDVVYIALNLQDATQVNQLLNDLRDTTVCVYFVPNITAFSLMQARVYDFEGIPLIAVWETPFISAQVLAKRLTDLMVAGLALVLTMPVMVGIAIALKVMEPREPILQRQTRYNLMGQAIVIYEFRVQSKPASSAMDLQQSLSGLGAFLRQTRLALLPQLINVLQGRLSLVGPRPQLVAYKEIDRKQLSRCRPGYRFKPGLIGLAQIHGLAEEDGSQEAFQKRMAYDLDYLQNWSFWLDLKIIAKTALVSLKDNPLIES